MAVHTGPFPAPVPRGKTRPAYARYSVILAAVVFLIATSSGWAISPRKLAPNPSWHRDPATLTAIGERLNEAVSGTTPVAKPSGSVVSPVDGGNLAPVFLDRSAIKSLSRNAAKPVPGASPFETALAFVGDNRDLFHIENPQRALRVIAEVSAPDGRRHLRLEQLISDLPVWGSSLVFHFDADGVLYAVNGRYGPEPEKINTSGVAVNGKEAVAIASETVASKSSFVDPGAISAFDPSYTGPSTKQVMLAGSDGSVRTVWLVEIRPNLREMWRVFIDVRDGRVIEAYNILPSQTSVSATAVDALGNLRSIQVTLNNGTYYMQDSEANIVTYDAHGKVIRTNSDATIISSPDNTWKDTIAVSAQANARVVYNYYLIHHGRDGIDGKRMLTPLIVHYTEDDTSYDNAFWGGAYMAFGDAQPFARALDVVAHEMTHGVVQFTAGLDYKFQPGAINEAIADVMACMVDQNWTIGEDLPGGPIRDLSNPEKYGWPSTMSGYVNYPLSQDNGGVHENMGIPSHAFELVATSITREKTAQIVYLLLNNLYITPQAQFVDLRLAAVQASTDLYGADSQETAAVKTSFDAVGILNGPPSAPPTDSPSPVGGDWIAFVDNGRIGLIKPSGEGSNTVLHPSTTGVYTGTADPMSVSKDGTLLMFVDDFNNLRSLNLDTFAERLLDNWGIWSSIALSPDGNRLAATTIYADSTIYVFDLVNPQNSKAITLYTPSTEGVKSPTAIFADALDWDKTSTQIIYDVFHSLPVQGGTPIEFWDVDLLDVGAEIITRVKTPTDNGYQVGNPSFGETNDRYMVCDLFSDQISYNAVTVFDLYTLHQVEVNRGGYNQLSTGPFPDVGIPRYSPDDRSIVFQRYNLVSQTGTIYTTPLAEDKMTPSGSATVFRTGEIPVWYVRGASSGTNEDEDTSPFAFRLLQNRPNPFNPATLIPFTLLRPGHITLNVYDILGRTVATLVDEDCSAGEYTVRFDSAGCASGVYIYRLRVGSEEETRKMTLVQ